MEGPGHQTTELGRAPWAVGDTEGMRTGCRKGSLAAGWWRLAQGRACPVGQYLEGWPKSGLLVMRT